MLRVTPTKWPLTKCSLAEHRLGPILEDSKPCDKHSVQCDKSRNKYLGPWQSVDYTLCKQHKYSMTLKIETCKCHTYQTCVHDPKNRDAMIS